ncbi:MAG: alpha/beta fold hydrolase [Chloroflexi bacterium]|nr:alpha/beta fold hydrolase [Chloroflexota bacterium]
MSLWLTLLWLFLFVFVGLSAFLFVWGGAGEIIHTPRSTSPLTPSDFHLDSERVAFSSQDGILLRGWFIPAANSRHALIFSHGYRGDCTPDLIYAPLFHRAGYNQLYFDYRAHGASAGSVTSLVHFERSDLLAAIDFLARRGFPRIGLLGFSMGGAVAIATAPLSANVIAVATDCAFAELEFVMGNAARGRGIPRIIAPLVGWLLVAMASLRLRANLFAANPIHWVAKITPRPLLLMHAENDADVDVSQARELFRYAREPKALWIVPHTEHRKIEAVAGAEYRARIVKFFDQAFQNRADEA